MGIDGGNIQVMHGCRNYNGTLSNNYSYGTCLQVAIMVYTLKNLYDGRVEGD